MTRVLHIDSSILGDASASRALSRHIVDQITNGEDPVEIAYRDLAAAPLPHIDRTLLPGGTTDGARTSEAVLNEFLLADIVIIGAPMYNFTLPSQLKAWIDRILVAGRTFRYTETGPQGLAGDKRVIVAVTRGGLYGAGQPAARLEHLETYLKGVFGFIGISIEIVSAEGLAISPEFRNNSIATAKEVADRLSPASLRAFDGGEAA